MEAVEVTPAAAYSSLLLICRRSLRSFRPRENMSHWSVVQTSTGLKRYELYGQTKVARALQAVGSEDMSWDPDTPFLRPGRRFRSESQHLKKRTKRLFSVKNLVGFYYLWSIVANRAFKAVPSDCKICFPQYSVGFCCITLSLKYRQSSYQR